jgi:hypothetical protein
VIFQISYKKEKKKLPEKAGYTIMGKIHTSTVKVDAIPEAIDVHWRSKMKKRKQGNRSKEQGEIRWH